MYTAAASGHHSVVVDVVSGSTSSAYSVSSKVTFLRPDGTRRITGSSSFHSVYVD